MASPICDLFELSKNERKIRWCLKSRSVYPFTFSCKHLVEKKTVHLKFNDKSADPQDCWQFASIPGIVSWWWLTLLIMCPFNHLGVFCQMMWHNLSRIGYKFIFSNCRFTNPDSLKALLAIIAGIISPLPFIIPHLELHSRLIKKHANNGLIAALFLYRIPLHV